MKRYLISGACLAAFTIFMAAPISSTISVPAIFAHQNKATLFAPLPGKIIKFDLRNGMNVKKGQVFVQLISNEIQSEIELANLEVDLLKKRLSRIGADQRERAIRHVLEQELASKQSALQGIKEQQEKLSIVAPMDGILSAVDPELSRNIWLNANYPIAVIKPEKGASLFGYISENDYARISLKSAGKFIADSGEYDPVLLSVEKLANVASSTISEPYFADVYGGKIPIVQNPNQPLGNGEIKLRGGWYQINMKPTDATTSNLDQVITGTVILDAEPISFGGKIFKRAASILIRELGI